MGNGRNNYMWQGNGQNHNYMVWVMAETTIIWYGNG